VRQVPGWTRSGFLSPPVSPTSNPRFEGLTARAPPAVPTLADAQRLGVLALFQKYDTDGDGRVDTTELEGMVRDLLPGVRRERIDEVWVKAQARRLMVQMDLDFDGKIDVEEFLTYARANPEVYGLLGVKTLEESVIMSQAEIARAAGVARTSPRRIAAQAVALRDVSPMRAGITFRGSSVPSSPAASPGKSPGSVGGATATEMVGQKEHDICVAVHPTVEDFMKCKLSTFYAVASLKQIVAGTMWYIKVAVGSGEFYFIKVVEKLPHLSEPRLELLGIQTAKFASDRLEYFESNCSVPVAPFRAVSPDSAPTPVECEKGGQPFQVGIDDADRWEQMFRKYDVDGSGSLDLHEVVLAIGDLLPATGDLRPNAAWVEAQAASLFQRMDTDRDGLVSMREFVAYARTDKMLAARLSVQGNKLVSMRQTQVARAIQVPTFFEQESPVSAAATKKWQALFTKYDLDHNGALDMGEITLLLADIMPDGQGSLKPCNEFIKSSARKLMIGMDTNHDGQIDFKEFQRYALGHPSIFKPAMDG